MTDRGKDLGERIQELLDGRVSGDARLELERRIAADPEAASQLETLRRLQHGIRAALGGTPAQAPRELVHSIGEALDREDTAARVRSRPHSGLRWAAALAAVLLAGALGWLAFGPLAPVPLPRAVAVDVHRFDHGELALAFPATEGPAAERYFAEQGIDFPTRVFDLAMMDFHLVGATRHALGGGPSAAFAYRGPEGVRILCQMFRGRIDDLPATDDVREHDGIRFYSYKVDCVSMTFWREGDVLCVLASMADLERVVALAYAKAVKL